MTSSTTSEVVEISFISPDGDILLLTTEPYNMNPQVWGEYEEIDRPQSIALGIFDLDVVVSTNPDGIWRKRVAVPQRNTAPAADGNHESLSPVSENKLAEELLNSNGGIFYEISAMAEIEGVFSTIVRLYPQGYTGNSDDYYWTLPYPLSDYQDRIHPESLKPEALKNVNARWHITFMLPNGGKQTRSVDECSQPGVDQTYRDNEVYFQSKYGQTFGTANEVIRGSYTVEESMVSEGEDPKGRVKPVFTKDFGSAGKLNFSVGRHGTDEVANWFKARVKDAENTFGHSPDKLNFAFKGTLKLTVTGGSFEGGAQDLEFRNVYLAQGHTGVANNWWFGAEGAHNPDDGRRWVRANGRAKTPYGHFPASMYFQRGGEPNTDEKIFIYNGSLDALPGNAWMKSLHGSWRLQQLVLPGTHHSGMGQYIDHCTGGAVGQSMSKTQYVGIGDQLNMGVRYLDIRVFTYENELVCYHRTGTGSGMGCNGTPLALVLYNITRFLSEHPGEFVVLSFSHIATEDRSLVEAMLRDTAYNGFLFKYEMPGEVEKRRAVNEFTVAELRGKILVVSDSLTAAPASGFFRKSNVTGNGKYGIFDEYADDNDPGRVISDQLRKWGKHYNSSRYGFMLNWICTPRGIDDSIEQMAKKINAELAGNLNNYMGSWAAPQVVLLDFATPELINVIINQNLQNLNAPEEPGGGDETERPLVTFDLYPEPDFQGSVARVRVPYWWFIPVFRNIRNHGGSMRVSLQPWSKRGRAVVVGGWGLVILRRFLISKDYTGTGFDIPLLGDTGGGTPEGVTHNVFVKIPAHIRWFVMIPYNQ